MNFEYTVQLLDAIIYGQVIPRRIYFLSIDRLVLTDLIDIFKSRRLLALHILTGNYIYVTQIPQTSCMTLCAVI